MPQQPVEPAQGAAEGEPFVDVAEHDEALLRLAYEIDQLAHLPAPLGREEAEVGDDDAHRLAAHIEVDVERVARLAASIAELEAPHVEHGVPGEQGVAVRPVMAHERQARNGGHAEALRDVVEAVIHLLQADGVAVELADHRRDARGVLAAVGANAAMHVVGRDAQAAPQAQAGCQ